MVKKSEWDKVSSAEQERISSIIAEHFDGAKIIPGDVSATQVKGICTTMCNIDEAAAVAAWGGNSTCVMVAQTAGAACRAACR